MNKFMPRLLAFIFVSQPMFANAAPSAKVLVKRGEVTKLSPGDVKATPVKIGESLPEDTSILTGEKSMVRLKFSNNSTMNLGPKSKVVVSKMPEKKPNMINLLTGAIKAEVDKKSNKENKNKMIVKTRSAVMGVRGTKFQATYNPANKNTSLITVEGKVAMVKKEEAIKQAVASSEGVAEAKGELIDSTKNQVLDSSSELDALDKSLNEAKEVVEVDAGKYSGVQAAKQAPTAPVKIAPKQYEALAKSMGSTKKAEDVMKTTDAASELKKLGEAPRPGGYVDFETGLYVPPSEDAVLDEKTATYKVDEDLGKVDQLTGDYVPPKGVKLDAKKGFVVDKEEIAKVASAGDKEKLKRTVAKVNSLNKEIKNQIKTKESDTTPSRRWYLPRKHKLAFEILPYSETQTFNGGENDDSEFVTESAMDTIFSYEQVWNDKWSTKIALGGVEYEVEDEDSSIKEFDDEDEEFFSIGASYKLSSRWSLSADLIARRFYFLYGEEGTPFAIKDAEVLDFFSLGAKYFVMDWKKIGVFAGANVLLFGENELFVKDTSGQDRLETYDSFGLKIYGEGIYSIKSNMELKAGTFLQRITHEFSENTEIERTSLGMNLNFAYTI